jgi:nucleotide-binding universal stress UspA family protein
MRGRYPADTLRPGMSIEPIRRIVVGTDFSQPAATALGWASAIARAHGASLLLVHGYARQDHGLTPEETRAALAGLAAVETGHGLQVHVEMRDGPAAEVVSAVAQESGADLLVIGSRGRNPLSRLLLGSVADAILKRVHRPTLVVHPGDAVRTPQSTLLLVGMDFSPEADRAVDFAVRLAAPRDRAEVSLLHAMPLPGPFVGVEMPAVPIVEPAESEAPAREALARKVRDIGGQGVRLTALTCPGSPVEAMRDTAQDRQVDILVVGTTAPTGAARVLLGSVAADLVHHADRPVLIVR